MSAFRDWLCWLIVVRLVPARFLGAAWKLLPYAGRHAFRDDTQPIADARREMTG